MTRAFSTSERASLVASIAGLLLAFAASCTNDDPSTPPPPDGLDAGSTPDDAADPTDARSDADDASEDDAGDGGHDAGPVTYTNPVFPEDFPDPFVLRVGATYVAFATNAAGKNVRAAESTDLATWTELPDALPTLPSWARANASLTWAPSVLARGGTYVLYFTARDEASNFQCIGRAIANDPRGPYVDDTTHPFICQVHAPNALCGSIDASPFVDSNGDAYLLWKSDENATACSGDARLWTQRLGVDGLSLLGSPTMLLARDRDWELPLIEGPSMLKHGASYYLFYSANWWESASYGVGYAVCDTPIGPCTKKTLDGPLVASADGVLGPGGQEFFHDPSGALWMAYHAWTAPTVGYAHGGRRSLRIDRLTFPQAEPTLRGPTTTPQLL